MPSLDQPVETWFLSLYYSLKSLTGFEHHLSITDFKHYFEIYPSAFSMIVVISVIKSIESKSSAYQEKKREAKKSKKGTKNG